MQSKDNFLLIEGEETPKKDILDWKEYRIGYFLNRNKDKHALNEDSLFICLKDKFICLGVCDGAGGHPKGKDASLTASKTIIEYFKKNDPLKRNIVSLIESANDAILALKVGAHSAIAMSTIEEDVLRSFSVGDSEILYSNAHGSEIYSNIPQSQVGYKVESGILDQEASLDDPERNVVNNMMGDPSIRIEVASKLILKKGHTIIIGTDGLFDNISHEKLLNLMGTGSFEKSFEDLTQLCSERGEDWKKDDDIAFVVLRKIKSQETSS